MGWQSRRWPVTTFTAPHGVLAVAAEFLIGGIKWVTQVTWVLATLWIPSLVYIGLRTHQPACCCAAVRRRLVGDGLPARDVFGRNAYDDARNGPALGSRSYLAGVLLDRAVGLVDHGCGRTACGSARSGALTACQRAKIAPRARGHCGDEGEQSHRVLHGTVAGGNGWKVSAMTHSVGETGDGGGRAADASDILVIFGITGDLARKMTFRALYRLERQGALPCPIVGVAADDITVGQLAGLAREAITHSGEQVDDAVFGRLADRLSYVSGDITEHGVYEQLANRTRRYHRPLYYLEVPPALFGPIVEHLADAKLLNGATVAVEKPFGHDLDSARALNDHLHRVLLEDQILRIDHFLGKEPVIELEYLRFANLALAEVWDRRSVACIQITMAEDFGVEDRGNFYDGVGTLRDVVQNHLMQVLALVAMEPPAGSSSAELRDKKAEVFRAIPAADPAHCVRGQYDGTARSRALRRTPPLRPSSRCDWRSTTGDGRACPSCCAPARRCPSASPRSGWSCTAHHDWRSCPHGPRSNETS